MKSLVKYLWVAIGVLLISDIYFLLNFKDDQDQTIVMLVVTIAMVVINIYFSFISRRGVTLKFSMRRIVLTSLLISGAILMLTALYTVIDLAPFLVFALGFVLFMIPCLLSIHE